MTWARRGVPDSPRHVDNPASLRPPVRRSQWSQATSVPQSASRSAACWSPPQPHEPRTGPTGAARTTTARLWPRTCPRTSARTNTSSGQRTCPDRARPRRSSLAIGSSSRRWTAPANGSSRCASTARTAPSAGKRTPAPATAAAPASPRAPAAATRRRRPQPTGSESCSSSATATSWPTTCKASSCGGGTSSRTTATSRSTGPSPPVPPCGRAGSTCR